MKELNTEHKYPYGAWPTMVTAFNKDNTIDPEGNAQITDYLISRGSKGLFAVCQSSEMFFLSLDEKVQLASAVINAANGRVPVIVSGHTSEGIEAQLIEMKAMAALKPDAIILVSNRLADEDESDEVLLGNLKRFIDEIPNIDLGIYECPFPYKRELSDEVISFCAQEKRIRFIKDVSCDPDTQTRRAKLAEGSHLQLYNAHTDSMLHSIECGYSGFNGIMGNFHPDIYNLLNDDSVKDKKEVQKVLTELYEYRKPYPVSAKYYFQKQGLNIGLMTRNKPKEDLVEQYKEQLEKLRGLESDLLYRLKNQ